MFKKKSVEDIVRPITKITDELRAHAASHDAKADHHFGEVERHTEAAKSATEEAGRAIAHADKLGRLFA